MKKLIAVLMLGLTGCVNVTYTDADKFNEFSKPDINSVSIVSIGEDMVNQGTVTIADFITVKQTVNGKMYTIPKGIYKEIGRTDSTKLYDARSNDGKHVINHGMTALGSYLSHNKERGLCVSASDVFEGACYDNASYTVGIKTVINAKTNQQTLIYNGSNGEKINVAYVSYNGSGDRFQNNVEYDMSKSDVISYKGATLKVINYDNNKIEYKLLSYF